MTKPGGGVKELLHHGAPLPRLSLSRGSSWALLRCAPLRVEVRVSGARGAEVSPLLPQRFVCPFLLGFPMGTSNGYSL